MAEILKGAPAAKALSEKVKAKVLELRDSGIIPKLALVRVGENDGDVYYERNAIKRCAGVGIETESIVFSENVTENDFIAEIERLNSDDSVSGILIFRPLPKHISDSRVRETLSPDKDIDGITDGSLAGIFTGSGRGFCPCTAEACMVILDHYNIPISGKKACVVGRSLVIGKPVSQLLLAKNATVTICHTKTENLPDETKSADIIIAAAGHRGTIKPENVKPGQTVIDVGINTDENGNMCGDVDFLPVEAIVGAITPVPGGVGAVTTAILASHTVTAAERIAEAKKWQMS
jgi:methylenetetrahydrofolate dehydrogenase (NADP+)/methenyltetrahydrofolate cyclohydrolase